MKSKAAVHPAETELRTFALGFPDSYEDFPWGESAFKVKGKVFLFMYVHAEGIKLSGKLPRSHEQALARSFAEPTGYGLGKSGWVTSSFDLYERIPIEEFRTWIAESYRAVAPKKLVARLDEGGAVAHPPAPAPTQRTDSPTRRKPRPKRAPAAAKRGLRRPARK